MTLTEIANKVLWSVESGTADSAEEPLRDLRQMANEPRQQHELSTVLPILEQARTVMLARRSELVQTLSKLENSSRYGPVSSVADVSWEVAG